MLEFSCDKCGNDVILNETFTIVHYMDILKYEMISPGELITKDLPDFMFYQCIECDERYKLNFKEVELRVRKKLVDKAAKLRTRNLRAQVNPYDIDPDNGIAECGICEGFDGEGNCFKDFIKQCPVRNFKNA